MQDATQLKTENLTLNMTGDIASLSISGKLQADTFDHAREAFDALNASAPDTPVVLRIDRENFDNLSGAAQAFRQFSDLLRRLPGLERCAVVSDSDFLKNSAKVEAAAIPGLSLMTFAPEGTEAARRWLRGQSLTEDLAQTASEDAPAHSSPENSSNDNISQDEPLGEWGNISMKEVRKAL